MEVTYKLYCFQVGNQELLGPTTFSNRVSSDCSDQGTYVQALTKAFVNAPTKAPAALPPGLRSH
jgi:hypothetical protein